MNIIISVLIFVYGLIIGSFLNVVIYRLPRHESIIHPASHCPSCGKAIKPYDNIPLLSYIILRGKCRSCGARISPRYPLVEFLTGFIFVLVYLKYRLSVDTLVLSILSSCLIAITFIDIDYRIIPNAISYPGIIIGLISSFFVSINNPINALIGILVGSGILFLTAFLYRAITKVEGMGMGDVKLMAMIGAFLGWKAAIFTIIISAFLGSIIGLGLVIFAGKGKRYAIPYGPFIAISAITYMFYGNFLIEIYLRIIGYV